MDGSDVSTHPTATQQGPEPEGTVPGGPSWVRIAAIAGLVAAGTIALLLIASVLGGALGGSDTLDVESGIAVEVKIPSGASARTIAAAMESAGVVTARQLETEIQERGVADQLKAGGYALTTLMPAAAVVDRLVAGPNIAAEDTVAVREGASVDTIVAELAEQTAYVEEEFRRALLDGSVFSPYLPETLPDEIDPLARWEGLLFPARYDLPPGATPTQILQILSDEMIERMEGIDWSRLPELGVSRYEAVIVASLIEREAGLDSDRPLIASVVYNRLAEPMRLQIDATVVYARGETPGHVVADDLAIESPYNTYRVDGLPPTPIGTVRQASLEAAANPATTDYFFYVLVADDGTHGFSTTYEEHQARVEQAKRDGVLP